MEVEPTGLDFECIANAPRPRFGAMLVFSASNPIGIWGHFLRSKDLRSMATLSQEIRPMLHHRIRDGNGPMVIRQKAE